MRARTSPKAIIAALARDRRGSRSSDHGRLGPPLSGEGSLGPRLRLDVARRQSEAELFGVRRRCRAAGQSIRGRILVLFGRVYAVLGPAAVGPAVEQGASPNRLFK